MLTIGSLAKKTGTKVQTIRYYEQIGLMPEPGRTGGGQRRYGDAELDRLSFIRHSRQLGFPLDVIRELLDLSDHPDKSCDEADAIARRQVGQHGVVKNHRHLEGEVGSARQNQRQHNKRNIRLGVP